jgi:formylmethanofuran dehydrogenase subunit A
MNMENFKVNSDEIAEGGRGGVVVQACEGRRDKSL